MAISILLFTHFKHLAHCEEVDMKATMYLSPHIDQNLMIEGTHAKLSGIKFLALLI